MNPTTSSDALSQLQTQEAQNQNPNDILSAQRQQLGVNNAQNTVTGLRGAIDNTTKLLNQVAPSVMGRTGNSLVTSAQAGRIIQNEQAPLSTNLNQEGTQYNEANTDLSNLQNQAETAASGIYQGQQDKTSNLQNIYNALYGQEQDASKAAESQREFNAGLAEKTSADTASSTNPLSYLGGGGGAQMQQRSGGGYNFQDASGNATNAAAYSQAKGIPIRTLLQQMASSGDAGAKTALNYVGNDYGVNKQSIPAGQASQVINLLRSLGFKV